MKRILFPVVVVGTVLMTSVAAQTSVLRGTIVAEGQSPVAGVTAIIGQLHLAPAPSGTAALSAYRKPPLKVSAVTDKNGTFVLSGLETGSYYICVDDPSHGVLDPCSWGPSPSVSVGPATTDITITVERAAKLRFEIDDAGGRANARKLHDGQTWVADDLVLGILNDRGWFVPARIVTSDGKRHALEVGVRPGRSSPVWVFSRRLNVTDDAGAAIWAKGVQEDLASKAFDAGGKPGTVNLRITGSR
jgi:hypothetical protein